MIKKTKLIATALVLILLLSAVAKAEAPTYSIYLFFILSGAVPCADEFATRAECAE